MDDSTQSIDDAALRAQVLSGRSSGRGQQEVQERSDAHRQRTRASTENGRDRIDRLPLLYPAYCHILCRTSIRCPGSTCRLDRAAPTP